MDTAPYTLKVSNHLGDVRLQSKPCVEDDQVLYFTAQWQQDGGGVYDVTKLTSPEVSYCALSLAIFLERVIHSSCKHGVGIPSAASCHQTGAWLCSQIRWRINYQQLAVPCNTTTTLPSQVA